MTGVFASGVDVFGPLLLVERLIVVADFPRSEFPSVEEVFHLALGNIERREIGFFIPPFSEHGQRLLALVGRE